MRVTLPDVSMFIYHTGVVISGVAIVRFLKIEDRFLVLFVSALFAIVWTAYYKYSVIGQFEEASEEESTAE